MDTQIRLFLGWVLLSLIHGVSFGQEQPQTIRLFADLQIGPSFTAAKYMIQPGLAFGSTIQMEIREKTTVTLYLDAIAFKDKVYPGKFIDMKFFDIFTSKPPNYKINNIHLYVGRNFHLTDKLKWNLSAGGGLTHYNKPENISFGGGDFILGRSYRYETSIYNVLAGVVKTELQYAPVSRIRMGIVAFYNQNRVIPYGGVFFKTAVGLF